MMSGFGVFLVFIAMVCLVYALRGVEYVDTDYDEQTDTYEGHMKITKPFHLGIWMGIGCVLMLCAAGILFRLILKV